MRQLCLITGGSQGLGAALTQAYCQAHPNTQSHWEVFSLSRNPTPASESVTGVKHMACDLSSPAAACAQLAPYFKTWSTESWDAIHLIHNAARVGEIGPLGSQAQSTPEDWQQTLDLNFGAVVHLNGLFLKYFQQHPAQKLIAHISSGAAHKAYAGWSLYCATKAAMERFALCIAEEQRGQAHPICSVIINPGVMDTGMQKHIRAASPEGFPQWERFIQLKADGALPQATAVAERCFAYLQSQPQSGDTFKIIF